MKSLHQSVLAVAVMLSAVFPAGAVDLRVVTWDVEDAYPLGKAAVLAQAIKKHKVDILALQSVQTSGTRFDEIIQKELDKLVGRGVYRHAATSGSRFDGNAIFWNTRMVQIAGVAVDKSLDPGRMSRPPVQILSVRAGSFEFQLVNVNLAEDHDVDGSQEMKRAERLCRLLKKIEGRDFRPVILAGNLDMGFPGEKVFDEVDDDDDEEDNDAYERLNPDGFLHFCTRELARKKPHVFSYVGDVLEGGRLTDHIAANAPAWKHYIKGSAEVVRIDREFYDDLDDYEWNFSDHLPVISEFKTK